MDIEFDTGTKAGAVSGVLTRPDGASALLVLAHGAGAGMRHRFMEAIAVALGERKIAVFRYQFPYTQAGRRQPDRPPVLEATVRAAVGKAHDLAPDLSLLAGGKSMGGRMTSSAAAHEPLAGVGGLVFLGFPLHPPGAVGDARADHLGLVRLPMLFIQGTRDALADLDRITAVRDRLGEFATIHVVQGGDHSFAVPKRDGRTEAAVLAEIAGAIEAWRASLGRDFPGRAG
jgi:predicted alpha/beta-hydrolase family hydrolase